MVAIDIHPQQLAPNPHDRGAQTEAHKAFTERNESGYVTSVAYYRYWDHNVPMGRVLHLLLDLASGRVTDLFEATALELPRDGGGNDLYDVHPDGRCVAFVHDPAPEPLQLHRLAQSEIELRTRSAQMLLDDEVWDIASPACSPDGLQLVVAAAMSA